VWRGETLAAPEGEAAEERQVTALVIQTGAAARTGTLSLGAAAGGFTLAGAMTMSDSFALFL